MFLCFARKILIFYKEKSWGEKIFNEIIECYNSSALIHKKKIRGNIFTIILKDGVSVSILPCNMTARGYRGHEIYMQSGISKKYYDEKIIVYLREPGRDAYIIDSCFDIKNLTWQQRASYYYTTVDESEFL